MSKYVKFFMQDGVLVYRNTGKAYTKDYTIKGNTVYVNGRKVGQTSKTATKTQRERIEKSAQKRQKELKKVGNVNRTKINNKPFTIQELQDIRLENFVNRLNDMLKKNVISKEQYERYLNRYLDGGKSERSKIWKELNRFETEKRYYPDSP